MVTLVLLMLAIPNYAGEIDITVEKWSWDGFIGHFHSFEHQKNPEIQEDIFNTSTYSVSTSFSCSPVTKMTVFLTSQVQ